MLSKLEIKETRDTPEIIFDPQNDLFLISGSSLPEDSSAFFEPIFDWIAQYIKSPNKSTTLICKLEYFNSSSAKMLYDLFFEFEKIAELEKDVKILWYFEPEDKLIEEKGLEYQSVVNIPFEMIEK